MNAESEAGGTVRVGRACLDESPTPGSRSWALSSRPSLAFWPVPLSWGALTSADGPVVAPGRKHVAHFHTGDPLGPLQVIALIAGELDAGA